MAHIDKKNNQESKKLGQNTKKQLAEMKVEAASEIGFSIHSKKNAKVKNKYS
ncbi:small, acid-soluble spore protein, alpha/beta type [Clostridium bowmanii]|uniref:small, acid-soluble spore protein, alpha/beta type n=1 Tax=Clostridium bowmanii TaxID=132925 RepID=UPI001C0B31F1|nr:small, acid-soluble spore protein, alpha/beta type [Clostridium bowmanii]MBU3188229.1 small, acid-soluble spore protein, alpha/beta type [Clostridium bowmanii]MCA1072615.1 small, acid-soluble spore protein, alpha/beta type [Clostridium bowmanii]